MSGEGCTTFRMMYLSNVCIILQLAGECCGQWCRKKTERSHDVGRYRSEHRH